MKKIILFLFLAAALTSWIQKHTSNESKIQSGYYADSRYSWRTKEDTLRTSVLRTGYKPAFKPLIDTFFCTVIEQPSATKFGAKIQNDKIENQINVAKQMGLYCIRPASVDMDSYTGGTPKSLRKFSEAGFFTIVNITQHAVRGSNIVEYMNNADTASYAEKLRMFFKENKQYIGIACIENEPINKRYYKGDFLGYINQLKISVRIAHEEGIKVADGAMHLELIDLAKANYLSDKRAFDTKRLLDAIKDIPVDYINVHTSWSKRAGGYRCPDIPGTVQWIRNYTGKQVISNEYSSLQITPEIEAEFVNKWKQAKVIYCIRWSGDGWNGYEFPAVSGNNKADALNWGTTLTPLGMSYKDAIK